MNDLVAMIASIQMDSPFEYLKDHLGHKGVKVIYEKKYTRIMLGSFRRTCEFKFPGLIMVKESNKYRVASVPPAPPISQFKRNMLNNPESIIQVNDGTTVTLYYYNNEWIISTHRGYDVSNYIWFSNKTYRQVLDEVLSSYTEFNFNQLSKIKSYTIGFKHHEYHPFDEGCKFKAWFIQSVDLNQFNDGKLSVSYTDNIGIPIQKNIDSKDSKLDLQSTANTAFEEYKKNKTINYGYIVLKDNRQYLIESSLLKNIRNIFYVNNLHKIDSKYDRHKYIIIQSFLDATKHDILKELFPQYQKEYKKIHNTIHTLADNIYNIAQGSDKKIELLDVVSHELYKNMGDGVRGTDKKTALNSIIYPSLYNPKLADLLYNLIH